MNNKLKKEIDQFYQKRLALILKILVFLLIVFEIKFYLFHHSVGFQDKNEYGRIQHRYNDYFYSYSYYNTQDECMQDEPYAVTICRYIGNDRNIVIPDTINGIPVTSVEKSAFINKHILSITPGKYMEQED